MSYLLIIISELNRILVNKVFQLSSNLKKTIKKKCKFKILEILKNIPILNTKQYFKTKNNININI